MIYFKIRQKWRKNTLTFWMYYKIVSLLTHYGLDWYRILGLVFDLKRVINSIDAVRIRKVYRNNQTMYSKQIKCQNNEVFLKEMCRTLDS